MLYYICLLSLYEYKIISINIKVAILIQKITFIENFNKKLIL